MEVKREANNSLDKLLSFCKQSKDEAHNFMDSYSYEFMTWTPAVIAYYCMHAYAYLVSHIPIFIVTVCKKDMPFLLPVKFLR